MALVELAEGIRLAVGEQVHQGIVVQVTAVMTGGGRGRGAGHHLGYSEPEAKRFT